MRQSQGQVHNDDEGKDGSESVEQDENQLSNDLALFLSNPSLRDALTAAAGNGGTGSSFDLTKYSEQVTTELHELENECIEKYKLQSQDILDVHAQLHHCQDVLLQLHEMLLGFQVDLKSLSGDIQSLQTKSRLLEVQLRNRTAANASIRDFLEQIVISPSIIHTISQGPINASWVAAVNEVNSIYCHVNTNNGNQAPLASDDVSPPPSQTVCGLEIREMITTLRNTAVLRIRDYFLLQIALLRSNTQTNVRMIQVHGLLKYATLQHSFLQVSYPVIANEIYMVYCESMNRVFTYLFRTYQSQLLELDITRKHITRQDVIAIDDAVLKELVATARSQHLQTASTPGSTASSASWAGASGQRTDVFALGSRAADVLNFGVSSNSGEVSSSTSAAGTAGAPDPVSIAQSLHEPIVAHVALAENKRYHYERLYKSLIGHLVEAVTNEHVFCRQFFGRCDSFPLLFHHTITVLQEQIENYLFTCYDAICLILLIKVTHHYRQVIRARTITSLDPFFDQITKLLWPRLKFVMDNHLRSIQQANATKLNSISSTSGTSGGSSIYKIDLHAHYVSRRFAEFTCSLLLVLNASHSCHKAAATSLSPSSAGTGRKSFAASAAPKATTEENSLVSAMTKDSSLLPTSGDAKSAGDMLLEDIGVMVEEYVELLNRLAEQQHHTSRKKRIIFLVNNLDCVVCIFQERRVMGKELSRLVELLMQQREAYVEEELLSTGFSQLIAFVQQTEHYLATAPGVALSSSKSTIDGINSQVVEALVLEFASNWKSNLEQINRNVLSYFSNFRNGIEILKQVLAQCLLYYTRFQEIIRKVWRNKPPAFCKDLISTNVILAEIKKYAISV
jgi:vacuolar protein sorting-associated protein 52